MSTVGHLPMTPSRWKSLTSTERVQIRQSQIKLIEQEQLLEDNEALRMTEGERQTLLSSFSSVKTEFCDLDGLSWGSSTSRKGLNGLYGSVGYFVQKDSDSSVPFEITNKPVMGLSSQVAPNVLWSGSGSRVINGETKGKHKRYAEIRRLSDQNQGSDLAASDTPLIMCRDETIRASHYRRLSLPLPFPPTTAPHTTTTPDCPGHGSPPRAAYAAGTALSRCSETTILPRGCSSSIRQIRSRDTVPSVSFQPQPVGSGTPISRPLLIKLPLADGLEEHRNWGGQTTALGLPISGLELVMEERDTAMGLTRSHLEFSQTFDPCYTVDAPSPYQPSTPIQGLPHASVSGWPSPFHQWNSSQPQPVLALDSDVFTILAPPSTASQWLAIYQDPQSPPSQTHVSKNVGLGLRLTTTTSLNNSCSPFSKALDVLNEKL